MNYFRINYHNENSNISIIILFLGNYFDNTDLTIGKLEKMLKNDEYEEFKPFMKKSEFNKIVNNQCKLFIVDDNIYGDDSIYDIKHKIILQFKKLDIDLLVEEIYMFGETLFYYDNEELFEKLSKNNESVKDENMNDLMINLVNNKKRKDKYSFSEFVDLGFDNTPIHKYISLGIKLNEKLSANPIKKITASDNRSIVENNRLLYEYRLDKNEINIINFNNFTLDTEIIKTYFPMLTSYGIENKNDMTTQRNTLKNNLYNSITSNTINKFSNIKYFNDYSDTKKVTNIKIQYISVFLKSLQSINLPLEHVFKLYKTSEEIPLIKFNPGSKKEYMFRLYSNESTTQNVKLPFVNKSIIRRYLVESRGKVNVYITFYIHINNSTVMNINLFENGDVEIVFDCKVKSYEYNEVEKIIKEKFDMFVTSIYDLSVIQNHFKFSNFSKINGNNILINDFVYTFDYTFNGNVKNLNKKIDEISGNIAYIFKLVHNSSVNIAFDFERISTYTRNTPKMLVNINNKLLNVYVEHVSDIFYVNSIMNYFTGLINIIEKKKEISESKLSVLKDIDESIVNKDVYFDKFNNNDDEQENVVEEKEVIEYENEGDNEDDIIDNESIGFSETSEKSVFENDENVDEIIDDENIEAKKDDVEYKEKVDSDEVRKDSIIQDESYDETESVGLGYESDGSVFGGVKKYYDYKQQRIKSYDPKLFDKNKELEEDISLKYKAFSKTCPTSEHRQPIILSKEEKDYIDSNFPNTYGNHFLEYSYDPKNPYYYICPRYWCVEKNISLGEEHVKKDSNGNIVSDFCKDDGEYGTIITSDLQRQHRDKDDPNKYLYNRPGFGKSCIPCCFKQGNEINEIAKLDPNNPKDSKKIKTLQEKIKTKEQQLLKPETKCQLVNEDREIEDRSPIEQKINKKSKIQFNYIKQHDKIPLEKYQLGEISNNIKQFLHVNEDYYRFGVENNRKQSYIACISCVYAFEDIQENIDLENMVKKIKNVSAFKKEILKMIDIDTFSQYHNGDLNVMFSSDVKNKNIKVKNYSSSKFYNEKEYSVYFQELINSYENFIKFMKGDSSYINYHQLWEITTSTIFKGKYNLVIIEYDNNGNVYLVCPENNYAHQLEKFDERKSSIILLKYNEFFEPLFMYKKNVKNDSFTPIHTKNMLSTFFKNISYLYKNSSFCGVQPSINDEDNKYRYMYNTSTFVYDTLRKYKIKILKQVINYQYQNIGFIIQYKNKNLFLPNYPTKSINDIDIIYVNDKEMEKFVQKYSDMVKLMDDLFIETNKEIPCTIKSKMIHKDNIIGVYTVSNEFIRTIPEKNKYNDKIQSHVNLSTQKDGSYLDPFHIDDIIHNKLKVNSYDEDTYKLLQNQNMYTMFRKRMLFILSDISNKKHLMDIIKLNNTYNLNYESKFLEISKILIDITKNKIGFTKKKKNIEQHMKDIKKSNEFPQHHLLNDSDNEKSFYNKLVDEIIRYKQMNIFFKLPRQYVSNNLYGFNLDSNEIITFQSFLLQDDFFQNNDYDLKLYNDNFNLSQPLKSTLYSNEVLENDIQKKLVLGRNKLTNENVYLSIE